MPAVRLALVVLSFACVHVAAYAVAPMPLLAEIADTAGVDVASHGSLVFYATSDAVYIYQVGPAGQYAFRSRYVAHGTPITGVEAMTGWMLLIADGQIECVDVSAPDAPVYKTTWGFIPPICCLACDESRDRLYLATWNGSIGAVFALSSDPSNPTIVASVGTGRRPYHISAGYNSTLGRKCCVVGAAGAVEYYDAEEGSLNKTGEVTTTGIALAAVCDNVPTVGAADDTHLYKIDFSNPAFPVMSTTSNTSSKRDVVSAAGGPWMLTYAISGSSTYDIWSYAGTSAAKACSIDSYPAHGLAAPTYGGTTYLAVAVDDNLSVLSTSGTVIQSTGLLSVDSGPIRVLASRTQAGHAYAMVPGGLYSLKLLPSPNRIVVTNVISVPYGFFGAMTSLGDFNLALTVCNVNNHWVGRRIYSLADPEKPQDVSGSMGGFLPYQGFYRMAGDDSHWGVYTAHGLGTSKYEFRSFRAGSDTSLLQTTLPFTPYETAIEWPRIYISQPDSELVHIYDGQTLRTTHTLSDHLVGFAGYSGPHIAASGDYLFAASGTRDLYCLQVLPGFTFAATNVAIHPAAGYQWLGLRTCGPYLYASSFDPVNSWTKIQAYSLHGIPSASPQLTDEATISGAVGDFDVSSTGLLVAVTNWPTVAFYGAPSGGGHRVRGDIDGDGEVTLEDFARFFQWTTYCKANSADPSLACDLNPDGILDHSDYRLMADLYLTGDF